MLASVVTDVTNERMLRREAGSPHCLIVLINYSVWSLNVILCKNIVKDQQNWKPISRITNSTIVILITINSPV